MSLRLGHLGAKGLRNQVPDLGVAHLPGRQADVAAGGMQEVKGSRQ
jgi:hypothetical protein